MGMTASFLRVDPDTLQAFLEDSSLLEDMLYHEDDDIGGDDLIDIDKSWDGILFLLTGSSTAQSDTIQHPLFRVVFSGQLVDEEQDLGYGPAHYLTAGQVKEVHASLTGISVQELRSRYDAAKMTKLEVYPLVWEQEGDEGLDYLCSYYEALQKFYAEAAAKGLAVITVLS